MRVQVRGPHPLRPGIQPGSPDTWFSATAGRPVGAGARDPATPRAQPPTGITRARFGHHPLSLATTHGISFPAGTEMFHFPAYPPHTAVPAHDGRWVPPFGNPRIKALLAAPRGISQPQTSFIGPVCQGIHHTPLQATHTTKVHGRKIPLANSQTTNHHTKNDHKTIETNNRVRFEINSKTKIQKLLFCSRPLSSSQATTHRHAIAPAHGRPPGTTGIESRQAKSLGWRSGSPKAHPYHPAPTARPAGQSQRRLPHQQPRRHRTMRRAGRTPSDEHPTEFSVERR